MRSKLNLSIAKGQPLPLAGMTYVVGDNISVKGLPMTAGSKILEGYTAPYDASVITALREAGAEFFGKAPSGEFGSEDGEDKTAKVVALEMAAFGLASDAWGGLRIAAAKNGLVGLKPTYSSVSRCGLAAYASSFEQIGCIARSAEDCAKVFRVISFADPKDQCTMYNVQCTIKAKDRLRVGKLGADVKFETVDAWESVWRILSSAEAATNLARYDGVKFGLSVQGNDIDGLYKNTRTAGFGDFVKKQIMLGNHVLGHANYNKYFVKAAKVRTLIIEDFAKAFEKYDVIVTPAEFKYTVGANIAGLPALAVGNLQLIGRAFEEQSLFNAECRMQNERTSKK